jgi:hypothetical protein
MRHCPANGRSDGKFLTSKAPLLAARLAQGIAIFSDDIWFSCRILLINDVIEPPANYEV